MIETKIDIATSFMNKVKVEFPLIEAEPLISPVFKDSFTNSAGPTVAIELIQNKKQKNSTISVLQPCIRYWDIENVGDDSHLSYFNMIAVASFKENERYNVIKTIIDFLIEDCEIEFNKLYATYCKGGMLPNNTLLESDIEGKFFLERMGFVNDHIIGVTPDDGFVANKVEPIGGYKIEMYFDNTINHAFNKMLEVVTSVTYNYEVDLSNAKVEKMNNFQMHACGFGVERLNSVLFSEGKIWELEEFKKYSQVASEFLNGRSETDYKKLIDTCRALTILFDSGASLLHGKENKGRRWILNKYSHLLNHYCLLDKKCFELLTYLYSIESGKSCNQFLSWAESKLIS